VQEKWIEWFSLLMSSFVFVYFLTSMSSRLNQLTGRVQGMSEQMDRTQAYIDRAYVRIDDFYGRLAGMDAQFNATEDNIRRFQNSVTWDLAALDDEANAVTAEVGELLDRAVNMSAHMAQQQVAVQELARNASSTSKQFTEVIIPAFEHEMATLNLSRQLASVRQDLEGKLHCQLWADADAPVGPTLPAGFSGMDCMGSNAAPKLSFNAMAHSVTLRGAAPGDVDTGQQRVYQMSVHALISKCTSFWADWGVCESSAYVLGGVATLQISPQPSLASQTSLQTIISVAPGQVRTDSVHTVWTSSDSMRMAKVVSRVEHHTAVTVRATVQNNTVLMTFASLDLNEILLTYVLLCADSFYKYMIST